MSSGTAATNPKSTTHTSFTTVAMMVFTTLHSWYVPEASKHVRVIPYPKRITRTKQNRRERWTTVRKGFHTHACVIIVMRIFTLLERLTRCTKNSLHTFRRNRSGRCLQWMREKFRRGRGTHSGFCENREAPPYQSTTGKFCP
jgi:hypothetical protein